MHFILDIFFWIEIELNYFHSIVIIYQNDSRELMNWLE